MTKKATADFVLMTREIPDAELLKFYADSCNAGFVTLPSADGATGTVFFPEGDLAVVLAVPKMIDYGGDLSRVLDIVPRDLPAGARYWTEGVARIGTSMLALAVPTALADHCGGKIVIRATSSVL